MKKLIPALTLLDISASGFDDNAGKYANAASTNILYVPVTGQYATDNLKLTVPYILASLVQTSGKCFLR